jgi:hypothetical protein
MLEEFPFSYRVALLLGLMTVAATVDYWRRRKESTRYLEYSFICIAGILGGLCGFANDCLTSSISPDYFILGKGLVTGDGLRWRAGVYGLKAGFSAGAVGGAVCLFLCGRNSRFSMDQMLLLLKALWMPVAGAVLLGMFLPMIAGRWDPLGLSNHLNSLLDTDQIGRFRRVWWIHMGLYAGLTIGLIAMILRSKIQVTRHPESV